MDGKFESIEVFELRVKCVRVFVMNIQIRFQIVGRWISTIFVRDCSTNIQRSFHDNISLLFVT